MTVNWSMGAKTPLQNGEQHRGKYWGPTMDKANLMLLLAVVSSNVLAEEWVVVSSTDDGGVTVYADQSTVRKEHDIVKIRTLGNFKKA